MKILSLVATTMCCILCDVRAQSGTPAPLTAENAEAAFRKADAEMNRVYQEKLSGLKPDEQEQLKRFQQGWIEYRDVMASLYKIPERRWRYLAEETTSRAAFLKNFTLDSPYPPPGYHELQGHDAKSGKADFEIKIFQSENNLSQQTWLVSKKDPSARRRLIPGRDKTGEPDESGTGMYFISPDAHWIFRVKKKDSDNPGCDRVFHRKKGIEFEDATEEVFDDMAWDFFAKTIAFDVLEMDTSSVGFKSWSVDGKKLRVSLSGTVDRKWTIDDWQCDFDLLKHTFAVPASLSSHNGKAVKAEAEQTKYPSPNGKFAMRQRKGSKDEVGVTIELIEVSTRKAVLELSDNGNSYPNYSKLVWSADSERVAFFEAMRHGGLTTVYFRSGSEFKEIPLPELPDCIEPERWLKSGELVLAVVKDESTHECKETITIAFSGQKASIQKVTKKK